MLRIFNLTVKLLYPAYGISTFQSKLHWNQRTVPDFGKQVMHILVQMVLDLLEPPTLTFSWRSSELLIGFGPKCSIKNKSLAWILYAKRCKLHRECACAIHRCRAFDVIADRSNPCLPEVMFQRKICTVEMLEFLCELISFICDWHHFSTRTTRDGPANDLSPLVCSLYYCSVIIPSDSVEIQGKPNLLWSRKYDCMRVLVEVEFFVMQIV